MATIPDELHVSNEKSAALVIPYHQDRNDTIDQHIHAVVSYANPATQLLFATQSGSHLPEAGLNPLVDSASYLFFLMGKLKRIKEHHHLSQLHFELVKEVRRFQEKVRHCRYNHEALEEYIPIASYALCMALDDLVADTTWGGHGKWKEHSIVTAIFSEAASQKSFFIILERVIIEPNAYIDVVEFLYICLSFGMKCRNDDDSYEFTHEQHGQVSNFLYKYIQAYRGNVSKVLSPFAIKPVSIPAAATFSVAQILDTVSEHSQKWLGRLKAWGGKPKAHDEYLHNDLLNKSLQKLDSRFNSAVHFIKKAKVTRKGVSIGLEQLPWYLLIGSPGSGKSSLLTKSNINFILGKKDNQQPRQKLQGAHTFDWWITPGAVLVDVPGSYITITDRSSAMSEEVWHHFLMLIQKNQKRKEMGGIVVAVSVPELIDRESRDQMVKNLKYRIEEIQSKFGADIPFYFTITKMDLLPGFIEFFNDRSTEELMQAWGITMPPSSPEAVTSIFIKRFNALIKILNNQMIQRLHYERDLYAKSSIKDFPLYVERVKDEFAGVLNALKAQETRFTLKGVYLTSALQNQSANESVHPETVSEGSENMLEIMSAPKVRQSPYFLKQFILQGIMQ